MRNLTRGLFTMFAIVLCFAGLTIAEESLPLLYQDDFESGVDRWSPTDESKWKVTDEDGDHVYHLLGRSDYAPPHRSPHSISMLKDLTVGDFVITVKVKTLQSSRAHRDMCLFFGYQDPAHFYYVHLGEKTDPHANQIFIVNDAPRIKISEQVNSGTPWKDDTWHTVKLVRNVEDGLIEVYFDDMSTPQMVAHDRTFQWGQIGLGSFDDFGMWNDLEIRGRKADRESNQ
ncbi:hypothetical protein KOR42_26850 [Thalassoglobus neptunius]|uniref:Laminin G domain protein n=1 Tax=Thalassoglobus neptunius TaxID=1938619 RepID=A0A5C5WY83_9PLAN|nr:hypothetical protein [Thalassoglobus neptunius]TWT55558.1 hypothetical protein KOR42_26850 [Thalassoglobus neptunius]